LALVVLIAHVQGAILDIGTLSLAQDVVIGVMNIRDNLSICRWLVRKRICPKVSKGREPLYVVLRGWRIRCHGEGIMVIGSNPLIGDLFTMMNYEYVLVFK
jgi:hypothetical protein